MRHLGILSVIGSLLFAGTAFAQTAQPPHIIATSTPPRVIVPVHPISTSGPIEKPPHIIASTTPPVVIVPVHPVSDEHGTSTHPLPGPLPELRRGIPGTVSSVASTSFMLQPSMKKYASTTIEVNVTSDTRFNRATTTDPMASLYVGERVQVIGTVSTSTQSVTAERIVIKEPRHGIKGIIDRLHDLFGNGSSDDSAAAVEGSGIAGFLHALFGWL